jgi:RimJ/RimL family protein N-acetyltransferase
MTLAPIAPEMCEALTGFLDEMLAVDGSHPPLEFARLNGYEGVEGYVTFWRLLAAGPVPAGIIRTDTLVLLNDGRVLGEVRVRHGLTPRLEIDGGSIGYGVRPSERGKGYATRMLRAAVARAAEIGIARALITVDVTNEPSLRVVAKCGGVVRDEVPADAGAIHRRFWISTHPPRR